MGQPQHLSLGEKEAAWPGGCAWLSHAPGPGGQRGHRRLLTPCSPPRPAQRTEDELELIFEELLHIKAVAHISNSVSVAGPRSPLGVSPAPSLLLVPESSCIPALPI